eukprot:9474469-Pyramimonas_sp.AAC.2
MECLVHGGEAHSYSMELAPAALAPIQAVDAKSIAPSAHIEWPSSATGRRKGPLGDSILFGTVLLADWGGPPLGAALDINDSTFAPQPEATGEIYFGRVASCAGFSAVSDHHTEN